MKITSAKRSREEIIRDRDEYDANKKALHDQHDEQMKSYRKALYAVYENVKTQVEDKLANFMDSLNLDVNVTSGWRDNLEVRVGSNQNNVHGKDKALSWDWRASLTKEGEIKKETGSWSGLQAVTEAQLESLRQSVTCLEILNSIDWAAILSTPTPDADEYVTVNTYEVDRNRPNYEAELLEAELDEIIGQNKLVEGERNQGKYYRGTSWFGIVGETAKMYKVFEVSGMYVEAVQEGQTVSGGISTLVELIERNRNNTYTVTKEKFHNMIVKPLNILEA